MTFGENMSHNHPNPFPPAPECDDQLPLISPVGIGLKGNSYRVEPGTSTESELRLVGKEYDSLDGTWTTDWISENISGGKLKYQYHLRPYTIPQTFTITFALDRPGQPEWEWTTPAIPYIWDADDDGIADVDHIIGVGLSTFFLKKTQEAWDESLWGAHSEAEAHAYQEKTVYPSDWDRDELNAPEPYEPYAVALDYGIGGDIDAPNIDDFAEVLGVSVDDIRDIIDGVSNVIHNSFIYGDNFKEYIDNNDDDIREHAGFWLNADGSFGQDGHGYIVVNIPADQLHGTAARTVQCTTIMQYVDAMADQAYVKASNDVKAEKDRAMAAEAAEAAAREAASAKYDAAINAILSKIYGGGTLNSDGTITWPNNYKVPVADINIFSGTASPSGSTYSNALRSRALSNNDIKTV